MLGANLLEQIPTWPEQLTKETIDDTKPLIQLDVFPCILATLGSAFSYHVVHNFMLFLEYKDMNT